MSKMGKRKEEEEDEEEFGSDEDKPLKKPRTAKKDANDDDGITVCELSKNRRVSVQSWKGMIRVDIREFYMKDGKHLPHKKGISLTLDQWNILRDHVGEIDKAVAENT